MKIDTCITLDNEATSSSLYSKPSVYEHALQVIRLQKNIKQTFSIEGYLYQLISLLGSEFFQNKTIGNLEISWH
jgi:hypothetical protein